MQVLFENVEVDAFRHQLQGARLHRFWLQGVSGIAGQQQGVLGAEQAQAAGETAVAEGEWDSMCRVAIRG